MTKTGSGNANDILPILSSYINRRDNAKKSSPFYIAGNAGRMSIPAFNDMINAHHKQIAAHLPLMNIPAMQDFVAQLDHELSFLRAGADHQISLRVGEQEIRLPSKMNVAEMEALTELMKSRLSWMRIQK